MKKRTLFRQVVNEINKIDFSSSNKDRHIFNDIYESILKELQNVFSSEQLIKKFKRAQPKQKSLSK